jgi:hypothetical protein
MEPSPAEISEAAHRFEAAARLLRSSLASPIVWPATTTVPAARNLAKIAMTWIAE